MNMPSKRVLCVDDQAEAAALMVRHLTAEFECIVAGSPSEALRLFEQQGPFPIVIADYLMPDMNGVELLGQLRRRAPDTVGILVTSVDDIEVVIRALHDGNVFRFLRKPWIAGELQHLAREAFEHYRLRLNERLLREQLARTNAALDEKVQDLDEANELLEYWVEYSPAVLYSFSCEDGVLHPSYISKNFLRLTGYERTSAVVDPEFWNGLLLPEDRPAYRETLVGLVSGDDQHRVLEYRIRHRAGALVTIVDSLRAARDSDGRTVELVGAWMDISARS